MAPVQTFTTLGGTAAGVKIWKIGHGLMMMTWTPNAVPDEQCFEAIKTGVDMMPEGVKMLLNSGEFYAHDLGTGNLELLARFFEKYPTYAEKTFLSVKGGIGSGEKRLSPDSSPENLRRSITAINAALRGTKRVDLFESARVDHDHSIEDTIRVLAGFVKEGLFDHIGLSECSAATLRRAHSVHPITMVEIEVSPWSLEEETKKVLATAQELDIAVAAYSPLGRGFLTGTIKSVDDLPEGDMRRNYVRFSKEDYFKHNMAIIDALKANAEKKGVTAAQLTLAWVASLGPKVIPIPGSSHVKRTTENTVAVDIKLSEAEAQDIWDLVNKFEVKGGRYEMEGFAGRNFHLWG